MTTRSTWLAPLTELVMAALLATTLDAGQFKRSLGRGDSVKTKMPAAPTVRIGRATLAIDVKDATGGGTGDAAGAGAMVAVPVTQLQAALDQVFRESFTIVQSSGDALLRVAIIHYAAAESSTKSMEQKVRVPGVDPATGQQAITEQVVPVEQWIGRGQIAVRVEVVDSAGALLDGFAPQASIQSSQVISVNGADRIDRTQLPTSEMVLAKLISDLVGQFRPRYCPPALEVDVPLAVDDELRQGNQLARSGDLAGAAKLWEASAISKQENAGDRIHNLGSAYEIQAYGLLMKQADLTSVGPYLQRAAKHYAEAAAMDPEEKYISRAHERAQKAIGLVEALTILEQRRQKVLAAKTQPSPWPPGASPTAPSLPTQETPGQTVAAGNLAGTTLPDQQPQTAALDSAAQEALEKALNDTRADTQQEVAFRQFVNLRLRSAAGVADENLKRQIESTGLLAYSLSALAAKRVVHQETQTWSAAQPKVSAYRESFGAFAQDGRISPEERAALRVLANNLALTDAEMKMIESHWKVAE